jgi:preprotein translocase subunit YajC
MYQIMLMMGSGGQGGGSLLAFLPLIVIIFIMYLFMIRPQAKKQREHKAMLDNLQKGDKVMTSGGLIGSVAGFKENEGTVIVKFSDSVKIEMSRNAIAQVLTR